jgi:hypothetical protein
MATFRDPAKCFAPIEVIERLIGIREEFGFSKSLYVPRSEDLTDILDAYGFDVYAFSTKNDEIDYDLPTTPVVPGGDNLHSSLMAH